MDEVLICKGLPPAAMTRRYQACRLMGGALGWGPKPLSGSLGAPWPRQNVMWQINDRWMEMDVKWAVTAISELRVSELRQAVSSSTKDQVLQLRAEVRGLLESPSLSACLPLQYALVRLQWHLEEHLAELTDDQIDMVKRMWQAHWLAMCIGNEPARNQSIDTTKVMLALPGVLGGDPGGVDLTQWAEHEVVYFGSLILHNQAVLDEEDCWVQSVLSPFRRQQTSSGSELHEQGNTENVERDSDQGEESQQDGQDHCENGSGNGDAVDGEACIIGKGTKRGFSWSLRRLHILKDCVSTLKTVDPERLLHHLKGLKDMKALSNADDVVRGQKKLSQNERVCGEQHPQLQILEGGHTHMEIGHGSASQLHQPLLCETNQPPSACANGQKYREIANKKMELLAAAAKINIAECSAKVQQQYYKKRHEVLLIPCYFPVLNMPLKRSSGARPICPDIPVWCLALPASARIVTGGQNRQLVCFSRGQYRVGQGKGQRDLYIICLRGSRR